MAYVPIKKQIRDEACKLVYWQFIGVVFVALIFCALANIKIGYSLLLGGLAFASANLLFVMGVFRFFGAKEMPVFLVLFGIGEVAKLFLSGVFFILIVKFLPVNVLFVLMGFVIAIISFWIASLFTYGRCKA